MSFAVHGIPIAQGSKDPRIVGRRIRVDGQIAIVNPQVVLVESADKKTKKHPAKRLSNWRDLVSYTAQKHFAEPLDGPVELTCHFVLPRPKSHFTSKGELTKSAPRYPGVPDLSKLTRAVEDSLTGIAYSDDARIVRYGCGHSKRYPIDSKDEPGVRVQVRRIEWQTP